jgi:hypothetical protein
MHNVYTAWLAYFFAKVRSHGWAFWSVGEYPIMVSTQPDLRFGLKVLKQNFSIFIGSDSFNNPVCLKRHSLSKSLKDDSV